MYPKTAIKILIVIATLAALVLVFVYIKEQSNRELEEARRIDALNQQIYEDWSKGGFKKAVDKKNKSQELTEREAEQVEAVISQKIEEKRQELDQKTDEEIKTQGYTQEELNFIANPQAAVEKELGIKAEQKEIKFYTPEELEAIANPQ